MNINDDYKKSCDKSMKKCTPYEKTIDVEELARAYVPYQKICSYFEPKEALIKGTVFPSLYRPYK